MTQTRTRKNNVIKGHKITWWVYAGSERIRYNPSMRGRWEFDATCECGWDSRTGGAIRNRVIEDVEFHKYDATHP